MAITIWSALISSSPIRSVFGPVNEASPWNTVTFSERSRQSRPPAETASMRPKILSRIARQSDPSLRRSTPSRLASAGLAA